MSGFSAHKKDEKGKITLSEAGSPTGASRKNVAEKPRKKCKTVQSRRQNSREGCLGPFNSRALARPSPVSLKATDESTAVIHVRNDG